MVATRLSYPAKRKNFFTLEVNKKNSTDAALAELLGSRTFDGDVTKDLVVFRDPTSEFKDSVRVETENGHLVGWIRKSDSKQACQILDTATKALQKSKRRLKRSSFAFHVTADVYGSVERESRETFRGLDAVEVLIQDPVEVRVL